MFRIILVRWCDFYWNRQSRYVDLRLSQISQVIFLYVDYVGMLRFERTSHRIFIGGIFYCNAILWALSNLVRIHMEALLRPLIRQKLKLIHNALPSFYVQLLFVHFWIGCHLLLNIVCALILLLAFLVLVWFRCVRLNALDAVEEDVGQSEILSYLLPPWDSIAGLFRYDFILDLRIRLHDRLSWLWLDEWLCFRSINIQPILNLLNSIFHLLKNLILLNLKLLHFSFFFVFWYDLELGLLGVALGRRGGRPWQLRLQVLIARAFHHVGRLLFYQAQLISRFLVDDQTLVLWLNV